jgi:hypothetical protein
MTAAANQDEEHLRLLLETPSSKLQAPEKLQIPSPKTSLSRRVKRPTPTRGGGTGFPRRFGALEFGIFLELGAWSFASRSFVVEPNPEARRQALGFMD